MKRCSVCKETKTLDDFYQRTHSRDGRQTHCKACSNTMRKKWGKDNPERQRRHWLKDRYGITPEQFETMLVTQGKACALCRDPFTRTPMIDHDHATGRVRGLLCMRCNILVGWYESEHDAAGVLAYIGSMPL